MCYPSNDSVEKCFDSFARSNAVIRQTRSHSTFLDNMYFFLWDGGTKDTTISGLTRCTTQHNYFAVQPRILTVGAIIHGSKTGAWQLEGLWCSRCTIYLQTFKIIGTQRTLRVSSLHQRRSMWRLIEALTDIYKEIHLTRYQICMTWSSTLRANTGAEI